MTKRRNDYYILDGQIALPCPDLIEWGRWMQRADRHVAQTQIGALWVSTVFLGLDHGFSTLLGDAGNDDPILFETMIFNDGEDDYQTRCATWAEAEDMHAAAVAIATERVRKADETIQKTTFRGSAV